MMSVAHIAVGVLVSYTAQEVFNPHYQVLLLTAAIFRAAAMVQEGQEAPLKIYARGVVSFFIFPRTALARELKIRQINNAIFKVLDAVLSC
jgi:hypothetical protein